MKLPSLDLLLRSAAKSFVRFPFSILSALLGAALAIYMVEKELSPELHLPMLNVLLCAGLGIPVYFCVAVFLDHFHIHGTIRWLYYSGATLALVLLYFTFPGYDSTQNTSVPYIRYGIYNAAVHLLTSFIPFIRRKDLNGFWNYNKILFLRICESGLYSGVLYVGLVLALVSMHTLFDVHVPDKLYFQLFVFIGGVFNTWFFVSGIPDRFDDLEAVTTYPKGLKVFSQYILLSLLMLYLAILYVYTGKIIVLWSWPKGIVSYLVICVSVLGILALLLVHPYGRLSGNEWIRKFSRIYYFLLFPLVIVLFIAIYMRIEDYGMTVSRYAIFMLGVWLTIVCIYFSIGKTNIKFIPVSLAIILILVSFGPWGIFSVSERSQVKRLRLILEQGNILKEGSIVHETMWVRDSIPKKLYAKDAYRNENLLSDSLHNEVKSIMDYLDTHHGFASIRSWYAQDIDSILKAINDKRERRWSFISEEEAYMQSTGLKDEYRYHESLTNGVFTQYFTEHKQILPSYGSDYRWDFYLMSYDSSKMQMSSASIDGQDYSLILKLNTAELKFTDGKDTIDFNLLAGVDSLNHWTRTGNEFTPNEKMILSGASQHIALTLQMTNLTLYKTDSIPRIENLQGYLFIKINK